MNVRSAMVVAVCGALASGCAITSQSGMPHVTPVLQVRHAGLQADGYYQLGRFLQMQTRYGEAEEAYLKALALDPLHVDANNGLGTVRALAGRYDEAHRAFNAALAVAPNHGPVLNNVGYAYLLERRNEQAADAFRRAVESEPGNARYRANLTLALHSGMHAPTPGDLSSATTEPASTAVAVTPSSPAAPHDAQAVRLVAAGPNVFELVVAPAPAPVAMMAESPAAPAVRRATFEVSNGHGAGGMARRIAGQLKSGGLAVRRITNQMPYGKMETHILYRPGNRRAAVELSRRIPGQPPVVESAALRNEIDVRLVLGKDLARDVAVASPSQNLARAPH